VTTAAARGLRFLSAEGRASPAFWLLQLFLFLGYTSADEEWEALLQLRPRLVLGGLVLLCAGVRLFGARGRELRARLEADGCFHWLVAFAVACALATLWAWDPALARPACERHLIMMVAYPLIVVLVRDRRDLLLTLLVFCAGHGFLALRAFTEYLAGRIDVRSELPRMMGVGDRLADPNSFAAAVVFALPLMAWVGYRAQSRLVRLGALAYAALAGISVVLTYSRSGAVLLVLALLWMLLHVRGRTRAALVGVLLLAAAGAALRESDRTQARLGTLFASDTYEEEGSTRGRLEGYEMAWRIAEERPLLGVGPGCWQDYREHRLDGKRLLPHTLWGQLLGTRGVLGTLAFLGFLLAAVARGLRLRRTAEDPVLRSLAGAVLCTLFLLLVSGLAAHNLERELWYLLPALLAAAGALSRPETAFSA